MTSRDFCFWLQGYFEIADCDANNVHLAQSQINIIRKHLALVFRHEIDGKMGDSKHQSILDKLHSGSTDGTIARC